MTYLVIPIGDPSGITEFQHLDEAQDYAETLYASDKFAKVLITLVLTERCYPEYLKS